MWEVAEANSVELMDQFGRRYPEYRSELVKRIQMVRGLKGARPEDAPKPREKDFTPSAGIKEPHWSARLLPVGIGVLVLASVSFATYSVIAFSSSRKVAEQPKEPVQSVPAPTWDQEEAISQAPPQPAPQDNSQLESDTWINGVPPAKPPESPLQTKVTIRIEGATLEEVLLAVAAQAGISIQRAPNMPNPQIVAIYENMPAMSVINDLGRHFKFTALPQGSREVLIIPAVDQSNAPRTSQPGGGYASTYPSTSDSPDSGTGGRSLSGPIGR